MASEKKYGDKIKVQMIENINYADMDQALTNLASKNELVIGVGGQTQAAVYKIAKRFPKVHFSIVGGNEGESAPNVAGYDVKQAEIAFVAGAAAAMLSKSGAVSYVGGMEIPSIVNAGKEFGNGAKSINASIKYFENYTGDFDDVAKSKEATLAAIAQGADVHYHILNLGLRGMEQAAKDKGTHIIGSYTDRCGSDPLYVAYSITGTGYQVQYAIDEAVKGSWKPGYKEFGLKMGPEASGMVICGGTAEQKAKLDAIMKDIMSGKITVLKG
jgi:basic membrane protein A